MVNKKIKRTVNKFILREIKKLRKKGYSYTDISLELQISFNTVMYHLNEKHREKVKKRNREAKKRDRKKYFRDYQKERYKNDPKFREKQKKMARDYISKKSKK